MKPQATRIGNQKKALNNRLTYLVRLTKLAQSKLNALRFHPKHAKWSAAILAVVAFTTVCLQAITTPRIESQAANQWHPVSIPAVAAPTVMPEAFVTESQPVADAIPELTESIFRIRNGDSLSLIFARAGYGASIVHGVAYETEHGDELSRIYPGQEIRFYTDADDRLVQAEFARNELEYYLVESTETGFVSSHVIRNPEVFPQIKSGTIDSSFYLAAQRSGLTENQIMELAALFGWDIDFVLEIRQGDSFSVVYEDRYLDGQQISPGNILAAEFINQGRVLRAVRYEDSNGRVAYYNPEGQSMRKAFLRAPLDVFRISSSFNLNRRHPVLNTIRAHKGTDYAAPTGTPIRATGDGRVTFAGVNGGYGNVVRIQHGQSYETLYAHMSRFASGVRNGTYVRQGQVIGYVGMTGLVTGPHLHYEFYVNGAVRNPVTVALPNGDPIPANELDQFRLLSQPMLALLDTLSPNQQYATFSSANATDI
jgi:murein DD-endopeptidase MepM/ murein hydrolase activator NlpD